MTRDAHDTNYVNTFISVADDCPAEIASVPPEKAGKTSVAQVHYEMLVTRPYLHRQDDVLFASSASVRGADDLDDTDRAELRQAFFAKPQACLRTSPLAKRYGSGLHFDAEGNAAAYPLETDEYQRLGADASLQQLKAMQSLRG